MKSFISSERKKNLLPYLIGPVKLSNFKPFNSANRGLSFKSSLSASVLATKGIISPSPTSCLIRCCNCFFVSCFCLWPGKSRLRLSPTWLSSSWHDSLKLFSIRASRFEFVTCSCNCFFFYQLNIFSVKAWAYFK